MKAILCVLVGTLTMELVQAASPSVEEFRKLPLAAREKAINEATPEFKEKLLYEDWRLEKAASMGPEAWKLRELGRAAEARGVVRSINQLFRTQCQTWARFLRQTRDELIKSKLNEADRNAALVSVDKEWTSVQESAEKEIEPVLLSVAVSSEAKELDQKAKAVLESFKMQHPSPDDWTVTRDDLAGLDKACSQIKARLFSLKRLSAEELEAEVQRLPDEEMHR